MSPGRPTQEPRVQPTSLLAERRQPGPDRLGARSAARLPQPHGVGEGDGAADVLADHLRKRAELLEAEILQSRPALLAMPDDLPGDLVGLAERHPLPREIVREV